MFFSKRSFLFIQNSRKGFLAMKDKLAVEYSHRSLSSLADQVLKNHDEIQVKRMEEQYILVNENDEALGPVAKKTCHLLERINNGMLHRGFSLFLFNSENRLLLQQRSDHKITFPGLWTETCSSHPLHTEPELEEKDVIGVKRAVQRRVNSELGITPDQVPLDTFQYMTRIQYMAENYPADNTFGESEIDYIFIVRKDVKEVPLAHNWNEVKRTKYVTVDELKAMIEKHNSGEVILTPWFRMICERFLFDWWANMKNLKQMCDHKTIHKLN